MNKIDPWGLLDYKAQLLGRSLPISMVNHDTSNEQEYKRRLDAAIANINSRKKDLTSQDIEIFNNITSIVVDDTFDRPFIEEKCGKFTLTGTHILGSSPAYLGSSMGHDGYHVHQYERSGSIWFSRGAIAEKEAMRYQLELGRRLGLTQNEQNYIITNSNDPTLLKEYWNSPVK